jgi:hypothetical protein
MARCGRYGWDLSNAYVYVECAYILCILNASRMFVPPRCLDDILRCGVYDTFAMAYHEI